MMKTVSQIVLGIFLIALISCEPSEQATSAFGDAFIITKSNSQDTIYGLALHAFANKNFQSVSASPVENIDVSYDLAKRLYQNNFYYETSSANFGTDLPQTGEYNFSAIMEDGDDAAFMDNLTDDILYPTNITKLEYNATDEQIDLEWEKDDDADIYGFSILDESDEVVFVSKAISSSTSEYAIKATTTGWVAGESPEDGKTYTILFEAFLYESIKTDMNLQCKSISTQEVTWGN